MVNTQSSIEQPTDWIKQNQIHDKVRDFFVLFSRFEYAMKRAEFVIGDKNNVYVDWKRFGQEYNQAFEDLENKREQARLKRATDRLLQNPPRKLVYLDNRLCWRDIQPQNACRLNQLLEIVRRVRNILFHGEKPNTIIGLKGQGMDRVEDSSEIIYACLGLDDDLKQIFCSDNSTVTTCNNASSSSNVNYRIVVNINGHPLYSYEGIIASTPTDALVNALQAAKEYLETMDVTETIIDIGASIEFIIQETE